MWDDRWEQECVDKPCETLDRAQPTGQGELPSLGPRSLAVLPGAICLCQHHYLLQPDLLTSCGHGDRDQTCLRASWPKEQVAVAQEPSLLGPQLNECRHTPFALLSPHGQHGRSCFHPGPGGGVKRGDELLGALMCSKGTGVRIAATFSSCWPGSCGAIPREVRGSRGKVCEGSC